MHLVKDRTSDRESWRTISWTVFACDIIKTRNCTGLHRFHVKPGACVNSVYQAFGFYPRNYKSLRASNWDMRVHRNWRSTKVPVNACHVQRSHQYTLVSCGLSSVFLLTWCDPQGLGQPFRIMAALTDWKASCCTHHSVHVLIMHKSMIEALATVVHSYWMLHSTMTVCTGYGDLR